MSDVQSPVPVGTAQTERHYRRMLGVAAAEMALAVIFGAFGAHALKDTLDEYGRQVYQTAVLYHLVHGLGSLAVVAAASSCGLPLGRSRTVVTLFAAGIAFFSGSLYALAITRARWLGAVTPIGGALFIAGWLLLLWEAVKTKNAESSLP